MNPEAPKTQPVPRGGENHAPPRESYFSLVAIAARNKLALTFCFLALIAIAVNVKIVIDVSSELSGASHFSGAEAGTQSGQPGKEPRELQGLRNEMAILLGVMIIIFGSMIFLYVKKVVEPLHSLSVTAREISKGNLSVTAPVGAKGDIGGLGAVINDLAANFQEVLLLTGTTAGNSRCSLEAIEKMLELDRNSSAGRQLQEQIDAIKNDLDLLGSVVKDFEFYHTRFDGRKVVPLSSRTKT